MTDIQSQVAGLIIPRLDFDDPKLAYECGEQFIRKHRIRSFVVFGGAAREVADTISRLEELSDLPLLMCADMERGAGQQWSGATSFPYFKGLGELARRSKSLNSILRSAEITAMEAKACGVHVLFSPVVDVDYNPDNPIISIRSFGQQVDHVIACARAYITGLESRGMLPTLKHFPGHGDTIVDSHEDLPELEGDIGRLNSVELKPFRTLCKAFPSVGLMTGHLASQVLDPSGLPASLSEAMTSGLLRTDWGYDGPIFTDALIMGAVADQQGNAVLQAFRAGADFLLMPSDVEDAIKVISRAIEKEEILQVRLESSLRRASTLRETVGVRKGMIDMQTIEERVGRADYFEAAREIAKEVVCIKRGIVPSPQGKTLVLVLEAEKRSLESLHLGECPFRTTSIDKQPDHLPEHDLLVVVTDVRPAAWKQIHQFPAMWREFLNSSFKRRNHLLISLGSDRLERQLPDLKNFLCTYGRSEFAINEVERIVQRLS